MDHNFKDILHNVNLTEGQIGVILCALETSTKYADSDYIEEVDAIFESWKEVLIGSMITWRKRKNNNLSQSGQTNKYLV